MVDPSDNHGKKTILSVSVFLLLACSVQAAYENPYNLQYIEIALAVNDTSLCLYTSTSIERHIINHLQPLNADVTCVLNSSSAATFAAYNVTIAVDRVLGQQKVQDIRNLGGSIILMDDAVIDYNNTDSVQVSAASFSNVKAVDNSTVGRGYPVNATVPVSGSWRMTATGDFTEAFRELTNNSAAVISKNYSSGSNVVLTGFIPTNSEDPFHTWRMIEKAIFWQKNLWSRLPVVNASSDVLVISDPRGTNKLSSIEANVYNWLQPEIGSSLTLVPVSESALRGYGVTERFIIPTSDYVTTLLPGWRASGKDVFFIYDGMEDIEYLFGGNVTAVTDNGNRQNLCNESDEWDDVIMSNRRGEITYGYPVNAHVDLQNGGTRYLANVSYENATTLAANGTGEAMLLYYSTTNSTNQTNGSSDVVAYGIDPTVDRYHGDLLLERAYDWLTDNLNIVGDTARRIALPVYGGNEGPTDQEDALYTRLIANYGAINVSKVNLSVANITDYNQTQLVVVHDYGKVSSLIPQWNASSRILFAYEGLNETQGYYGGTHNAFYTTSNKYVRITSADWNEMTNGYVEGAVIPSESHCAFNYGSGPFTTVLQNAYQYDQIGGIDLVTTISNSLLSYYNNSNQSFRTAAYGFSPYGALYHDWKLFDRTVEWLLGTLNVTGVTAGDVALIVYNNGSLSSEEATYSSRLDGIRNSSGYTYTRVEISIVNVSNFANTSAAVVPVPGYTGSYYKTRLLDSGVGLFLPRVGTYTFVSTYGGGGTLLEASTPSQWGGTGVIATNNSNHSYPTFGYPNRAKVQVCSSCGAGSTVGFTWASMPPNYVGLLEADPNEVGGAANRYTLISNNLTYSGKLVLMGFVPNTHHGLILFDRSIMWLLDNLNVTGKKTKDVVLVVYDESSLSTAETTVQGWINGRWGPARYSTLDVSDVMASELWGTSRYVVTRKDLITGVVNYWHNLSNGIIFLGESVNDSAIALDVSSIGGVDLLSDEYTGNMNGTISNSHYIVGNLTASTTWQLTTSFVGSYGIADINASLFTTLATHTSCAGTCPEVLLAAHQSGIGNMTLFGINPVYATSLSSNWTLNAIEWVSETDTTPPTINWVNVTPQPFANNVTVNVLANVTDNRCLGGRCLSVYNVTLNYTLNFTDDSNWTIATFTRSNSITDYWSLSLNPLYNRTYMIYEVIATDTTGNTNRSAFYYYGIPDNTTPTVYNISFTPYMPSASQNVTVHFNADEFVNATVFYRVYNTSTIWIETGTALFKRAHDINTGTHDINTYEYWITACDFSGNCRNETNSGEYYLFCIEPGCERNPPNITSAWPSNGTIFAPLSNYTWVNVTSDEWAECRRSSTNTTFDNMIAFNNTYGRNHTMTFTLANNSNNVYIRCRDLLGNNNTQSYMLYYFVDVNPPVVTLVSPSNGSTNNGSIVYFNYTAYDNVNLQRCSLYLNISDWSENRTDLFAVNNSLNSFRVALDTFQYRWNIRCWDTVNNSAFASANYTVNVDTTVPVRVWGSVECSENPASSKFCYPADISVGATGILFTDDFEATNVTNWTTVRRGSGVIDTATTATVSGTYALYTRTSLPTDYAYAIRNLTFDYPYIIDYWLMVPSQSSIGGAGGLYILQSNQTNTTEIEIMLLDNNTGLDVKGNGGWTYDVVNLTANGWYNIKVSMINETDFRLYVNWTYIGTYAQFSSAAPNSIAIGEMENDTGQGTAYFDMVSVLLPRIHVADTDNHRIQRFTMAGAYDSVIGSFGDDTENGTLYYPRGVTISDMGYITVADSVNDRIQMFYPNRTFKSKMTGLNNPGDVAVDENNFVYVADTDNNRITVYNSTGDYNRTIGDSLLLDPDGIDVYNGQVYVTDSNDNVTVFMENGTVNFSISYNMTQPLDIAIDTTGMIHVADTDNHRIVIFHPNGSFYQSFGSYSTTEWGRFNEPSGVDANLNIIYVADKNNNRIQFFSMFYDRTVPFTLVNPLMANYTITGFSDPQGVFIHPNGLLYIADKSNDTIMVYSGQTRNATLRTQTVLYNPSDVAVDGSQKVYVADTFNDTVTVMHANGTFYGKITGFNKPQGVEVDSEGQVYVADTNNNTVSIYYPNWTRYTIFGSLGTGQGQLNTPMDVAVDSNRIVYVADRLNHRIQVFNASGSFIMQIGNGTAGNASGQLDNPHSVDIDYNGLIYVADTNNNRIQIFNSDGSFNFSFTGNGTLNRPEGIAVDYNGMAYVADTNNSRVQAYNVWPVRRYVESSIGNLRPSNGSVLAPYTSTVMVNLTTDYPSLCRISNTSDTAYGSMSNNFDWSYYHNHSETLTGLSNNRTFTYYVRCGNPWGYNSTQDYTITYSIDAPDIVLNEFLPDPDTGPSWIEFYNRGQTSVRMTDWKLHYNDSFSSYNYTFNGSADYRGYLVLYGNATGIQFNLTQGNLYLINSSDTVVDNMSYYAGSFNMTWAEIPANYSIGRAVDGVNNWTFFGNSSIGASNEGAVTFTVSLVLDWNLLSIPVEI
ncbi:MAG: lamin tail domain-containing protein [Candidatus Altiarchaeota archaeon]